MTAASGMIAETTGRMMGARSLCTHSRVRLNMPVFQLPLPARRTIYGASRTWADLGRYFYLQVRSFWFDANSVCVARWNTPANRPGWVVRCWRTFETGPAYDYRAAPARVARSLLDRRFS